MAAPDRLILVDEDDTAIGSLEKQACHDGPGVLHRAFSIFLFDLQGRVLLQERSRMKRLWPRYWSNACCSHPRVGESLEQATQRRLREELGVAPGQVGLSYIYKFEYRATYFDLGTEHELCSVFVGRVAEPETIETNPEEVAATDWISPNDLDAEVAIDPTRFSPWFRLEWEALRTNYRAEVEGALSR